MCRTRRRRRTHFCLASRCHWHTGPAGSTELLRAITTPAGKEEAKQRLSALPKPRENALHDAASSQNNFLFWVVTCQSSHIYSARIFVTPVCSQTEVTAQHQYKTVLKIQSIRLPVLSWHHRTSWCKWWLLMLFHTMAQISPTLCTWQCWYNSSVA